MELSWLMTWPDYRVVFLKRERKSVKGLVGWEERGWLLGEGMLGVCVEVRVLRCRGRRVKRLLVEHRTSNY